MVFEVIGDCFNGDPCVEYPCEKIGVCTGRGIVGINATSNEILHGQVSYGFTGWLCGFIFRVIIPAVVRYSAVIAFTICLVHISK